MHGYWLFALGLPVPTAGIALLVPADASELPLSGHRVPALLERSATRVKHEAPDAGVESGAGGRL